MKKLIATAAALTATPALAAGGPFFSLYNTNFVVAIAFLVFIGILLWKKVPALLARLLDDRAQTIRNELDEARLLREEAQALVASYDARMKEVAEQSARIVASAKEEAQAAATQAKADLQVSITRRLAQAEDQINAAVQAAEVAVRNEAIAVSVQVAAEVLARQMTKDSAAASVEAAIEEVAERLH